MDGNIYLNIFLWVTKNIKTKCSRRTTIELKTDNISIAPLSSSPTSSVRPKLSSVFFASRCDRIDYCTNRIESRHGPKSTQQYIHHHKKRITHDLQPLRHQQQKGLKCDDRKIFERLCIYKWLYRVTSTRKKSEINFKLCQSAHEKGWNFRYRKRKCGCENHARKIYTKEKVKESEYKVVFNTLNDKLSQKKRLHNPYQNSVSK